MHQPRNPITLARLLAAGLASITSLAWVGYKRRNTRMSGIAMPDSGCETDPNSTADLGLLTPGGEPVHCQPWDIGTGVAGYAWRAPEPRAVLLLQHGYAEYTHRYVQHYNRLIPHLLNIGVSVYAFDMWGHGYSPGARALTDIGQAVEDHLTARRKLREQQLPVFVLGHSLGGLVTASSVVRDQTGLRGVILSSPALKSPAGESAALSILSNALAAIAPTLPAPVKPADPSDLASPDVVEAFANDPLIYRGRMPILMGATILSLIKKNPSHYPDWSLPTLVLHGTRDTWTDPDGSRALFEGIASEDKVLHLVDDGRHELLNDTRRDETLQVILTWLERRLSGERG